MITMLADHLWQSTLVALALGALAFTLRRHAARVRYALWLCASVKFLVPFTLLVALGQQVGLRTLPAAPTAPIAPAVAQRHEWGAMMQRIAQPATAVASSGAPRMAAAVRTPARRNPATALLFVWAAGTALVLGVWLARWRALAALVRRSRRASIALPDEAHFEARVAAGRIEPGVFGILCPVLLLPEGITERLSIAQLRMIVAHELCHVRRRDNCTAALHMLTEALFWFHPLVWWIGARLIDERERACDEAVVRTTDDPRSYADAIIAVGEFCVRSPLQCAAGVVSARGGLRERVERLVGAHGVRALGAVQRCALAVAGIALLAAPIVIGVLGSAAVRAQAATAGVRAPLDSDPPGVWIMGPRITAIDTTLRELIAFAFHVPKTEIVGASTLDAPRYTIVAELPVVDRSEGPAEQYRAYMRALLEQRFDLAAHRETAVVPALSLVSGAFNPGLKPVPESNAWSETYFARGLRSCGQPGCPPVPSPPNVIEARDVPIGVLREFLTTTFGKPVLDQTNLTEHYDFTLRWPAETARADRQWLPSDEVLRQVLEEQLGLELLPVDAPIERVMVDRIGPLRDAPVATVDNGADPPPVILRGVVQPAAGGALLELKIDWHGSMYFGHDHTTDSALDARSVVDVAAAALRRDPSVDVLVSADGLVANHFVVEAATLLQQAGATRIRFATLPMRPTIFSDDPSLLSP